MNKCKKHLILLFSLILSILCTVPVFASTVAPKLNVSSLKATTGSTYVLMLRNIPVTNTSKIQWKTSNSSVVALQNTTMSTANGMQLTGAALSRFQAVKIVGNGTAKVTATYKGKAYTCTVTGVKPNATIKVGNKTTSLKYGLYSSVELNLKGTKTAQIKVSNLYNSTVSYSNSSSSVVSISSTGKITAKKMGNALILVRIRDKETSKMFNAFLIRVKVTSTGTVTGGNGNTMHEVNIKSLVETGYNKATVYANQVLSYINSIRKNNGLSVIKLDSRLNKTAGYLLTAKANGVTVKSATTIARNYGYTGNVYVASTQNTTLTGLLNLAKSVAGNSKLKTCKSVGVYCSSYGVALVFGTK